MVNSTEQYDPKKSLTKAYEKIIDKTENLVLIVGQDLVVRFVNKTFLKKTGYSFFDVRRSSVCEYIAGGCQKFEEVVEQVLAGLEEGRCVLDVKRKLADEKPRKNFSVDFEVSLIEWNGEDSFLLTGQEYLSVNEKLHKQALEQSVSIIVFTDPTGSISYVNPGFVEATGFTSDEIKGKFLGTLNSDVLQGEHFELLWKVFRLGKAWKGELCNKRKDGTLFWEMANITPIIDKKGEITSFIKVSTDITELKKAEQALKKSGEAYLTIFNSVNDAIITFDPDLTILEFNQKTVALFDLDTRVKKEFSPSNDFAASLEQWDLFVEKSKETKEQDVVIFEWKGKKQKRGDFFDAEVSIKQISLNGRPVIMAVIRDITEQKRLMEQLVVARDEAESASKAKSIFLANMSHEIRTPLNAIYGFSQLIEQTVEGELKGHVQAIKSSTNTLLRLISDILDFSKIEAGKIDIHYNILNILRFLKEMEANIKVITTENKSVSVDFEIESEIPEMMMLDELRLRQVLSNIINNALKFTHEGYIKLSLRSTPGVDAAHVNLHFKIEDTGIGISEENQQKIFNVFEQSDGQSTRKYGGTGLGLAITKQLIELMNGRISVESKEGEGSTFCIDLIDVVLAGNETVDVSAKQTPKPEFKQEERITLDQQVDIDDIKQVISLLETEYYTKWQQVIKNNFISEIAEFGEELKALGVKYSVEYIQRYGEDIINFADNFDIVNLNHKLENFERIPKKLREYIK